MVKLGFIVEGAIEKIILEHLNFQNFLKSLHIDFISEVIDAKGKGNLLPKNIASYTKRLEEQGATIIFILTDLDNDECITRTKERINPYPNHTVIVCVKAVEAWFLADTASMQLYLQDPAFNYEFPEEAVNPFDEIKSLRKAKTGKGFTYKKILANSLVFKNNFSIQRAAQHPNCNSAKYFLKKITEVAGSI